MIVLAIVLLLIFGPKRLPEIGKSMGKGMREFKESVSGITGDEPAKPTPELPASRRATHPSRSLTRLDVKGPARGLFHAPARSGCRGRPSSGSVSHAAA